MEKRQLKQFHYTVMKEDKEKSYEFTAPLLGTTGAAFDLHEERENRVYLVDRVRILHIDDAAAKVSCISLIDED